MNKFVLYQGNSSLIYSISCTVQIEWIYERYILALNIEEQEEEIRVLEYDKDWIDDEKHQMEIENTNT